MNLAYQTALRHYLANGINRVVLLTDGAANLGNVEPESLKQKVEAHRKQGIALDCFGIGWEGYNDDLLEVLSRNGDGRYGFINSPEEAATEFAGQLAGALQVAASDVKVQVEFNPGARDGVSPDRLRQASAHQGAVPRQHGGCRRDRRRGVRQRALRRGGEPARRRPARHRARALQGARHERITASRSGPCRYTGNAVPLEQASPAMRLAATASAFSEWLVVQPVRRRGHARTACSATCSGVPEVYGADARPKKLEWMIRQAKSIAGK